MNEIQGRKPSGDHQKDGQCGDSGEEAGELSPGVAGTRGKEKKKRKSRKGEKCHKQWWTKLIVDIILKNDKFKNKLLLTNVKNVKNGHYYEQVKDESKKDVKRGMPSKINLKNVSVGLSKRRK